MEKHKIDPSSCQLRLVAYGPILAESDEKSEHYRRRDIVAALEMALAEAFTGANLNVLNKIYCRKELDQKLLAKVLNTFTVEFPALSVARAMDSETINIDADPKNANWLRISKNRAKK